MARVHAPIYLIHTCIKQQGDYERVYQNHLQEYQTIINRA